MFSWKTGNIQKTSSILVVIGRIYRYQFKCNSLKRKINSNFKFYCSFRICIKFWTFWKKKKNEPHSLSISEVIDSEKRASLKCIKGLISENPSAVNVLKTNRTRLWRFVIMITHDMLTQKYYFSKINVKDLRAFPK